MIQSPETGFFIEQPSEKELYLLDLLENALEAAKNGGGIAILCEKPDNFRITIERFRLKLRRANDLRFIDLSIIHNPENYSELMILPKDTYTRISPKIVYQGRDRILDSLDISLEGLDNNGEEQDSESESETSEADLDSLL